MNRHTVPARRGFTLIELMVVIAIISVIASLAVPGILIAREKANLAKCAHDLKQIYTFALIYSDKMSNGAFPFGRTKTPRAHESLNELVAMDEGISPEFFICPSSSDEQAILGADGQYVLFEENLSYAWTAAKTKNTAVGKPLACCKHIDGHVDMDGEHSGHRNGVNVLMTDGSVKFVTKERLDPETLLPPGLTR